MAKKIKEIDSYINKAEDFAKPILIRIRELVHKACPNVEEKIKWGFPHFDYKNDMMCSMAAFKKHAVMGFWKAALMRDKELLEMARAEEAMGHLGKMTSMQNLPPDKKMIAYIREAMELNELGIKLPARPKTVEKEKLVVPDAFKKALTKNKKALQIFEAFSYSNKKEYLQWLTEAKTEATRNKRMETAVLWISEGKERNWQYKKV